MTLQNNFLNTWNELSKSSLRHFHHLGSARGCEIFDKQDLMRMEL